MSKNFCHEKSPSRMGNTDRPATDQLLNILLEESLLYEGAIFLCCPVFLPGGKRRFMKWRCGQYRTIKPKKDKRLGIIRRKNIPAQIAAACFSKAAFSRHVFPDFRLQKRKSPLTLLFFWHHPLFFRSKMKKRCRRRFAARK